MNFTEEVKRSIYGPSFYQGLKSSPIKASIGYFFRLSFLLALLSTIVFSIITIPRFMRVTNQESVNSFIEIFPKELTLTIQSGHLSTNVPEPYSIKMPTILGGVMNTSQTGTTTGHAENLVVISTQADPSLSGIDRVLTSYRSHVLITGTEIVSKDSSGKITVQSLSSFPNMTIDQGKFREFVNKIRPFLKFIVPISIRFVFLGFLFYFSLNLVFALFLAIFILLLGKAFRWNISYWQSYIVGLYAMTLAILLTFLLNTLLSFLPFPVYLPQFVFTVITLLVVYINMRIKQESVGQVAEV
jgi:hypothetical protein